MMRSLAELVEQVFAVPEGQEFAIADAEYWAEPSLREAFTIRGNLFFDDKGPYAFWAGRKVRLP
jgi:hypothetical protein